MKIFKRILLGILILIALVLIVALFAPKDFKSEREIVINKPKQEVFDYIKYLKNQENYGTWYKMDPNMKKEWEGTDGTAGFTYKWESDKFFVGEGRQVITNVVEGERLETELFFGESPDPSQSYISVTEKNPNETIVKWGISGHTPYPWNFMNLVMDMGKDFDKGLLNLKSILEKK